MMKRRGFLVDGDLRQYVLASADPVVAGLAVSYSLAYNTLDISWIGGLFADEAVYGSRVVAGEMTGRDEIVGYLSRKFSTVRSAGPERLVRVELSVDSQGSPCPLIWQRRGRFSRGLGERLAKVVITADGEGRIARLFVEPGFLVAGELKGTDIFPGVDMRRLDKERARMSAFLPDLKGLDFRVYALDSRESLARAIVTAAQRVSRKFPDSTVTLIDVKSAPDDRRREMAVLGIVTLPTTAVLRQGELLLCLSGYTDDEALFKGIQDLMYH